MEGIESRAERHAVENIELQKKLALLETQNRTLVSKLLILIDTCDAYSCVILKN